MNLHSLDNVATSQLVLCVSAVAFLQGLVWSAGLQLLIVFVIDLSADYSLS